MTTIKRTTLALAALLAISATAASAQTLGDSLANGSLSQGAFTQLIAGTGLSPVEARGLTLDDIVAIKWQDD